MKELVAITFCLFLFAQCNPAKEQPYVLLAEFPPIIIKNAQEAEIKQISIYLKRNNTVIDTGKLFLYSISGNNIDVQFKLNKTDTLYRNDNIRFNLSGGEYIVSDFQKRKVRSPGDPYIISYKINNVSFVERNGYIDTKGGQ